MYPLFVGSIVPQGLWSFFGLDFSVFLCYNVDINRENMLKWKFEKFDFRAFNDFLHYIVLSVGVVSIIVFFFKKYYSIEIENAINVSATFVQSVAIIIGGLWVYHKFDWSRRAESAIKIKAMLMDYELMHNEAAMQYRNEQQGNTANFDGWLNYATKMIPARNNFASQVHLSLYLPKKTRQKLFDVVWLSLNKGRGPQHENLDENWKEFGEKLKKVKRELDDLVSK